VRLYNYFRSSASYRVRIALALKGLPYEYVPIHLVKNEQLASGYRELAPAQLVPALTLDAGADAPETTLTQSLAIIEYLDESHAGPPLLPRDTAARARVRAIALSIACEIHPLDNLRVLNYLIGAMGVSKEHKDTWYRHWIELGFDALETQLLHDAATGRYCHGDTPTIADICLVPQLANARRFNIDVSPYPTLVRIESACNALAAFADAAPSNQPDAE
jgi:maleylpyruvate isomerase